MNSNKKHIVQTTPSKRVLVLGAGLGGLAAAIALARRGVEVQIARPAQAPCPYGESLDWEANLLLGQLGLSLAALVAQDDATWKRGAVASYAPDGSRMEIGHRWVYRALMRLVGRDVATAHVDMSQARQALERLAQDEGVTLRDARATRVEVEGDRIAGVALQDQGKDQGQAQAAWAQADGYIDATGRARVLGRALGVARQIIGPRKVAFSARVAHPYDQLGTHIYLDDDGEHVRWGWGIHVGQQRADVGLALLADEVAQLRRGGQPLAPALLALAHRHGALRALDEGWAQRAAAQACSYQDDVALQLRGPNWWLVGEAGAMIDPILSGGVTFALRSGLAAARALAQDEQADAGQALAMRLERKLQMHARTTNLLIDRVWYGSRLRQRWGLASNVLSVLVPNFNLNHLHARSWAHTAYGEAALRPLHRGLDWALTRPHGRRAST